MGISSDGILAFGFDLGLEEENPEFLLRPDVERNEDNDYDQEEDYFDFDDFLYHIHGLGEYPSEGTDAEKTQYFEAKKKLESECPVELVRHCSYDYTMYIIAINGSEKRSYRGDPTIISPQELNIDAAKIEAAKQFCEQHNIPWQEPNWVLCSMYG